jgi:hypothetical protein
MSDDGQETERTRALKPPAVLANRFFIVADQGQVRISFGEAGLEEPIYHQASVMSRANALELANLITTLLSESTNVEPSAGDGGAGLH